MTIKKGIQLRTSEVGAIRCGDQIEGRDGKPQAHKLDKFRFTSPSLIELRQVAHLWGGEITRWQPRAGQKWGQQWQVYSEVDEIPIALPRGALIIRQDMEMYTGGGLARRCDGETMTRPRLGPCQCPQADQCPFPGASPEYAADWAIQERKRLAAQKNPAGCKPLTRFAVCLPDVGDIGVWILRTRSEEAAGEVIAKAYLMERARADGVILAARAALVQRQQMVDGVLRQYGVPVIRLDDTLRAIAEGTAGRTLANQLPPPPERLALTARTTGPVTVPPPGQSDMEVTAQALADKARAATTRDEIRPLIATGRRMEMGGNEVWAPGSDEPDAADVKYTLAEYLTRRMGDLPPADAKPARPERPARQAPPARQAAAAAGDWDPSWPANRSA